MILSCACMINSSIVDIIRCRMSGVAPWWVSLCIHRSVKSMLPSVESLRVAYIFFLSPTRLPLTPPLVQARANMTSSIKPEMQNASQRCQNRTDRVEPRRTKLWTKGGIAAATYGIKLKISTARKISHMYFTMGQDIHPKLPLPGRRRSWPYLTLGPPNSIYSQQHLDRFSSFCTAHGSVHQTDIQTHTVDRKTHRVTDYATSVATILCRTCMRCDLIYIYSIITSYNAVTARVIAAT